MHKPYGYKQYEEYSWAERKFLDVAEKRFIVKAYLPSLTEWKILQERFPAFAIANFTEKAKKAKVFGTRALRSYPFAQYSYIEETGCPMVYPKNLTTNSGLQAGLQIIYDPASKIVLECKNQTQTNAIFKNFDFGNPKKEVVTSIAPIVIFGKKPYIWLNKEECERGEDATMELLMEKVEDRAFPFIEEIRNDNYADMLPLHAHIERVVLKDCTLEEMNMIVPVMIRGISNYQITTPMLQNFATNESEEEK